MDIQNSDLTWDLVQKHAQLGSKIVAKSYNIPGTSIEGVLKMDSNGSVYILSNSPSLEGESTNNKNGYLYSWRIDPDSMMSGTYFLNYIIKIIVKDELPSFVKGRWYKNIGKDKNYIAKFNYITINGNFQWEGDGYILDGRYKRSINKMGLCEMYRCKDAVEVPVSEIEHLLPDGHPDKNLPSMGIPYHEKIEQHLMGGESMAYNIASAVLTMSNPCKEIPLPKYEADNLEFQDAVIISKTKRKSKLVI